MICATDTQTDSFDQVPTGLKIRLLCANTGFKNSRQASLIIGNQTQS